jgi:polysaccharide biosynthesis protein PslJ
MAGLTGRPPFLKPGWIVAALFMMNPVWWVLGFGDFAWCLAVFPLWTWIILRRNLRMPPALWLFVMFLVWALITVVRVDRFTRVLSFGFRYFAYLAALGLAIYVHNERRVTREKFIRWVAWFWVAAIIGGYIGLALPDGRINTTLASSLLPKSVTDNDFVGNLVRPGFAQVQNLFGLNIPRPKTLFSFTNEWGGNVGLLTPFFLASFLYSPKRAERRFGLWMLIVAVPPIIMSVNRGLWLTLILIFVVIAYRNFLQGHSAALKMLIMGSGLLVVLLLFTPLGEIVGGRLSESDASTREGIYSEAWQGTLNSPILGWGGPRPSINPFSPPIGTHGQVWMVMFSHGFVGLALYGGWALLAIVKSMRYRDRISMMLTCVVMAGALQAFFYNLLPTSLPIILTAVGLLSRPIDNLISRAPVHDAQRAIAVANG